MKNTAQKGLDKASIISMYNSGMSVNDIADTIKCSVATVYYHLQKCTKRTRGGVVSKGIPGIELSKPHDVSLDTQSIAEKNAQNACVVLESCEVKLAGTVGMYTLHSNPGEVVATFGENSVKLPISDIETVIEELKAVCRSAKSFDFGNAMW